MTDLSILTLFYLFLSGLVAGFVDSIAGGGGLITVPVLLAAGFSPGIALGTNKFQSSFGSFSATINFIRKKQVSLSEAWQGVFFTLIGSATGAFLVQQIDSGFLKKFIPILLTFILLYVIFFPELGHLDKHHKIDHKLFYAIFGLLIGFYDGFFGPGTGSLWVVAIIYFLGFNMLKATGYTKIMNFTSNIVALTMFLIGGNVAFKAGIAMAIGQFIGARAGSSMIIKKGSRFIKPLFVTVVSIVVVSLYYKYYFK